MAIVTPARGSTGAAPRFRFTASFDDNVQKQIREEAAERSKHARQKSDEGILEAQAFAKLLAMQTAADLQGVYKKAGFDIPVECKQYGRSYTIAVSGNNPGAQKWARLLEVGYGAHDLTDSLPTARRRRAIKVTRTRMTKEGPKTYQRGGDEATPGWYMIIPIVRGQLRQRDGKVTFNRRLRGGLSDEGTQVAKENAAELAELAVESTGFRTVDNHDGEASLYRTGEAGILGPEKVKGMPTTELPGYQTLDRDMARLAQGPAPAKSISVLDSGKRLAIRKNPQYAQQSQAYKEAQQEVERASRRQALLSSMGVPDAVVRSMRSSPEWASQLAGPEMGGSQAARRYAEQRGQVVSFRRISTRSSSTFMMPGRAGKHYMADAMASLRRQLTEEINRVSQRPHLTIKQQAYVDMLKSMAG